MEARTKTRAGIAALVYLMASAVLFGVGIIVVLTVPALSAAAAVGIPIVVVASFVLALPIAWFIAPRLRSRNGMRLRANETAVTSDLAAHPRG